jgi:hypothetical protein
LRFVRHVRKKAKDIIETMPLTLKIINAELAKRGFRASLAWGNGYFYFMGGEAADWPDPTVRVRTLQVLTLDQWMDEFKKLAEKNRQLMGQVEIAPVKPHVPRKAKARSVPKPLADA